MKFIAFLLPVFFLFSKATAQAIPVEALKAGLAAHQQADTVRINLLNEYAKHTEILPGFRDSLLEEALSLSRKLSYTAGEALALSIQSQYVNKSRGVEMARQAITLAEKSGNYIVRFWSYRSLGQAMLYTSENIHSIEPFQKALDIATAAGDTKLTISGQLAFVDYYKNVKINYPLALSYGFKALQTAEEAHHNQLLPIVYRNIGLIYLMTGDDDKSLSYLKKSLAASRQENDKETEQYVLNDIGEKYRLTGRYAEALEYYAQGSKLIRDPFNIELNQSNIADVYQRMGNDAMCFEYAFLSMAGAKALEDTIGISWIDNILSRAYLHSGKVDSAIYHGLRGYQYADKTQTLEFKRDNSEALANAFATKGNFKDAFYYYKIFITSRDSMLTNEIANKTSQAEYNYNLEKKQAEIATLNKDRELQEVKVQRQRLLLIGSLIILVLILISLLLLSRNISKRKKAYAQLQEQKQEIQLQRDQTNQALTELKLAQNQLIQSEKMASLGELTAGIAHEIQNPLNFVNNFSEVNKELIEELKSQKSKLKNEELDELLNDIAVNEEKINHHGKRADAIVKGMLQHSRTSTGQKELTDINELADEYLRLAYHGLRAKDKSFNAKFETDFDASVPKISIVPQDIGRVLLNLVNNAFYTVSEKQREQQALYEPTVSVSTKKMNNKITITVKDNGNGIPASIKEKIFQPFFTTKPTGQGTGLGLSLSYDIVTKGHRGELKAETTEGEGTSFIIILPIN